MEKITKFEADRATRSAYGFFARHFSTHAILTVLQDDAVYPRVCSAVPAGSRAGRELGSDCRAAGEV